MNAPHNKSAQSDARTARGWPQSLCVKDDMGKKLPPDQLRLYEFIDEILFNEWDPVGVSDSPEARDEYYGYLPQVFSKAMHGESAQNIADYLREVETERMGLSNYNSNCLAVAEKIIKEKAKLVVE